MDSIKGLFKSKVFYFNVVTGVLEVVNLFAVVLPPGTVTAFNVIGNIALRFITNDSLAAKVE